MQLGDKVTMTTCRATFRNDTMSGDVQYKAPKGTQFVFVLIGTEPLDGPRLDPNDYIQAVPSTQVGNHE